MRLFKNFAPKRSRDDSIELGCVAGAKGGLAVDLIIVHRKFFARATRSADGLGADREMDRL